MFAEHVWDQHVLLLDQIWHFWRKLLEKKIIEWSIYWANSLKLNLINYSFSSFWASVITQNVSRVVICASESESRKRRENNEVTESEFSRKHLTYACPSQPVVCFKCFVNLYVVASSLHSSWDLSKGVRDEITAETSSAVRLITVWSLLSSLDFTNERRVFLLCCILQNASVNMDNHNYN